MGIYKFEMTASVSDIFEVEADSYDEAKTEAETTGADGYYPVAPEGYSFPWDNVEVVCIEEPDDEETMEG
jgi:hypothetical protein